MPLSFPILQFCGRSGEVYDLFVGEAEYARREVYDGEPEKDVFV